MSEEEYGESDDEGTGESKSHREVKKDKENSKYTHSRFSSQIGDDLDEMNVVIQAMEAKDIDDKDIKIEGGKQLMADNRNLLKKKNLGDV